MTSQQEPVDLNVSQLSASTSFYLAALQSLGYRYINQQQDSKGTVSRAIGLGPESGGRIDLFLSQDPASTSRRHTRHAKHAHIVFPAPSRAAVRDFYAASLKAGGRPVRAPDVQEDGNGFFSATVADLDGNKVEVSYCGRSYSTQRDDVEDDRSRTNWQPSPRNQQWSNDDSLYRSSDERRRSSSNSSYYNNTDPYYERPSRRRIVYSVAPSSLNRPAMRPRSYSQTSSKASSPTNTRGIDMSSKAAVGTLLATAGGAALAYAVMNSEGDSRRKEADYDRRLREKEAIKAEARASQNTQEMPSRNKSRQQPVPRTSTDRDSGYYSNASRKDDSPPRFRSETYPLARERPSREYYVVRKQVDSSGLQRISTVPVSTRDRTELSRNGSVKSKSPSTVRPFKSTSPTRAGAQESKTRWARAAPSDDGRAPLPAYNPNTSNKEARIDSWAQSAAAALPPQKQVLPPRHSLLENNDDESTVVPDDSISCVGLPPPPRRQRSSASSNRRRVDRSMRDSRRRSIVIG